MGAIAKLVRRLLAEQPLRFSLVVGVAGVAGLVEGVGVASILPLLQIVSGGADASAAGTVGRVMQGALEAVGLDLTLVTALATLMLLLLSQQALLLLEQRIAAGSVYRFEADARSGLYRAVLAADWPFFTSHRTSELTNALTVESVRAGNAYQLVVGMLANLLATIVYLALALVISWQMTLLVAVSSGAVLFVLRNRVRVSAQLGRGITEYNTELQNEAMEHISGAKLIKGCSVEAAAVGRFDGFTRRLAHQKFLSDMNHAMSGALYDSISVVAIVLGIYVAVTRAHLGLESLVVFLFIFYRLSPRLSQMQRGAQKTAALVPALDLIDRLKAQAEAAVEHTGGEPVEGFSRAITFDGVGFGHDERPVLSGFDLSISRGRTTALVGPSGAGKTTAIDLLMGLLEPDSGAVRIDGKPLSDLDVRSWRGKIGYVAQESFFFHASVRENLALAKPDATDEEIGRALALAQAEEFVSQMPEGVETVLGERGVTLSGGQRQRLALARALLAQPAILILDEATSALDADAEERVWEALRGLPEGMTLFVVTHRLSAVRHADSIHVLEGGRIVESGDWDGLLAQGGRFAQLVAARGGSGGAGGA